MALRHWEEVALVVVEWERLPEGVEERHSEKVGQELEEGERVVEMDWEGEMVGVGVEERQREGVADPHMDGVVDWERLPEVVEVRQRVGVMDILIEGVEERHRVVEGDWEGEGVLVLCRTPCRAMVTVCVLVATVEAQKAEWVAVKDTVADQHRLGVGEGVAKLPEDEWEGVMVLVVVIVMMALLGDVVALCVP